MLNVPVAGLHAQMPVVLEHPLVLVAVPDARAVEAAAEVPVTDAQDAAPPVNPTALPAPAVVLAVVLDVTVAPALVAEAAAEVVAEVVTDALPALALVVEVATDGTVAPALALELAPALVRGIARDALTVPVNAQVVTDVLLVVDATEAVRLAVTRLVHIAITQARGDRWRLD